MATRRRKTKPTRARQYRSRTYRLLLDRLASNLHRVREAAGLTQEQAALKAGMTLRMFQRFEGRETNVTFTSLARLMDALGVDVDALLRSAP